MFTLEDVSKLIASLGTGVKGNHTLYVDSGVLRLEHRIKSIADTTIIATLAQTELRNGLTSPHWNAINKKLREYNEKHPA